MREHFVRLGKNVIIYGIGGALNRLVSVLLLPLMTAHLTPADYGIAGLLGVVSTLALMVFSLGIGSVLGAYYFDDKDPSRRGSVIWTSTVMLAANACLLALLGAFLAPRIGLMTFGDQEYTRLVYMTILTMALSLVTIPIVLYAQFEEKLVSYQVMTLGSSLLTTLTILYLVVVRGRGVNGMVEGGLLAQLATAGLLALFAPRPRWRLSRSLAYRLAVAGAGVTPGFLFLFVMQQGWKYILQAFNGLEAVGLLSFGIGLSSAIGLALGAFQNAWMPFFMSFNNRRAEASVLFGRILLYFTYFFGSFTLIFGLAARPALMILTTTAFHETYRVAGLAAGVYFFCGLYSILLPPIYFAKQVSAQTLIQAGAALLSVLLNLILIPRLGLIGAGIAYASGYAGMALITLAWNRSRRGYLRVKYPWGRLALFIPVYAAYSIVTAWKREWSLPVEIAFAGALALPLPFIVYILLDRNEREKAGQVYARFIQKARTFKPRHDSTSPSTP